MQRIDEIHQRLGFAKAELHVADVGGNTDRVISEDADWLLGEVARLREALKPFAESADAYQSHDGQHDYLDNYVAARLGVTKITVGHLRKARAALSPASEGTKP